jgi:hypothetical protein
MPKKKESGANVNLIGNKCYRCEHEWLHYDKDVLPRVYPKCKSPYCDRPKVRFNIKGKKNESI